MRFRPAAWIVALFISTHSASAQNTEQIFDETYVLDLLQKVNRYQQAHPWRETDRNWIRATYYTGVMGAYRATQDPAYLEQAQAWGEKHQWKVGTEKSGYNQLFCAMTWVELHLIDSDPNKIRPTVDWLATDAPTSPGGPEIWYGHDGPHENLLYSDSLYGAPVFPLLYKATGDRRYLEILHDSFWTVTDKLLDTEEDLYYRDRTYIGKQSPNGRKLLWSRGNGWVFAGLARVLTHLPKDDPNYRRYLDLYRRMAESIASRQHDDGLWRSNLGDPEHYLMPESSGTAFFTYSFAWGIREGLLKKSVYLPTVIKAWDGLVNCIHADGKMGWVQPVDAQPRPSLPVTTHEYATGLFLLAGGEVLKLVQAGTITPDAAAQHTVQADSILAPAATADGPLTRGDHPLADQINTFLKRQQQAKGFVPTGLSRRDYLEVIAGQVKAMQPYQDPEGRIIDPVTEKEMYYSTPCYAHSVGVLAKAGYDISDELLDSGMRALDISIVSLADNTSAGGHGDFFTWPIMFAYELFAPLASEERQDRWREHLSAMDITKAYRFYRRPYQVYEHQAFYENYGKSWAHNWNLLNSAGEALRADHGFTTLDYTDFCLTMQLPHFTPYGMYDEHGSPLAYDLFSRHYVAGLLHRGYRSFAYTTYRDLLWKGAWTSLFMQSPTGELPTGYRSSQHIWNEAEQAVVFEIYATQYARAGRMAEAGAFKRAAHLALQSVKNWIRPDGSGYIVKNRYPIEARHGHEAYSQHTCYNMLACSMLAQAWQFADENVSEEPSPADIGGFAVIPPVFHKVFINVSGTYIEYDTSGDLKYTPTGLVRVHLKNGHPQLGPSDGTGVGGSSAYLEQDSTAEENLAVGPAWRDSEGTWTRLAGITGTHPVVEVIEESADRVRVRITHTIGKDTEPKTTVTETLTVRPDEVVVENSIHADGVERMRACFPMLVFDGRDKTQVEMKDDSVKLTLGDRSVRFSVLEPEAVKLQRSGKELSSRNGMVEEVFAEMEGTRSVYSITAE